MTRSIPILVATSVLLVGCSTNGVLDPSVFENPDAIHGSGDIVIESRLVSGFDRIALLGEGHVIIDQGTELMLTVETDDNLTEYVETEVVDGVLEIRTRSGVDIDPTDTVIYRVGMNEVAGIEIGGAGSVDVGSLTAAELFLVVSGVGDIRIGQVDTESLIVDFAGVGSIRLDGGAVGRATVTADGVGSYEAGNVRVDSASVDVQGNASATLWVRNTLTIAVAGTGSVRYYGEPEVTSDATGLGTITALGDK